MTNETFECRDPNGVPFAETNNYVDRRWAMKTIAEKDARIAELEAALNLADKLAISVLGSWDAFEPALRSDIGNTNYRCVAEKVAEYRAARAALKGDK